LKIGYYILVIGVLLFASALTSINEEALSAYHNRCDNIIYTVKSGDILHEIATSYGSYHFWEIIYIANADLMKNPNMIYPGQRLKIPLNVAKFNENEMSVKEVIKNPFCSPIEIPISKINENYLTSKDAEELISRLETDIKELEKIQAEQNENPLAADQKPDEEEEQLEKFRELFNSVVQEKEETQKEKEQALLTTMDGMVYDETRSKIGRDFYDIFYTNWQAPDEANNFTIKILETPGPSLGTVVSVLINNDEIFQTRLQPRYETIEDAGKYAVRVSYSYLARNMNQDVQIY